MPKQLHIHSTTSIIKDRLGYNKVSLKKNYLGKKLDLYTLYLWLLTLFFQHYVHEIFMFKCLSKITPRR